MEKVTWIIWWIDTIIAHLGGVLIPFIKEKHLCLKSFLVGVQLIAFVHYVYLTLNFILGE
jgi:hypothetical protein